MEPHSCNHEADIGRISSDVDSIKKILYDNGQKGLVSTTITLATQMEGLIAVANKLREDRDQDVTIREDIRIALSGLLRFQEAVEKQRVEEREQKMREEDKKDRLINRKLTIYGLLIAAASILVGVLFNLA